MMCKVFAIVLLCVVAVIGKRKIKLKIDEVSFLFITIRILSQARCATFHRLSRLPSATASKVTKQWRITTLPFRVRWVSLCWKFWVVINLPLFRLVVSLPSKPVKFQWTENTYYWNAIWWFALFPPRTLLPNGPSRTLLEHQIKMGRLGSGRLCLHSPTAESSWHFIDQRSCVVGIDNGYHRA